MSAVPHGRHLPWRGFALGILGGLLLAVFAASMVAALSLLGGLVALLLVATLAGNPGAVAVALLVIVASGAIALWLLLRLGRRVLAFARERSDHVLAFVLGMVLALPLGWLLAPDALRDAARHLALPAGDARAPIAVDAARRQRLAATETAGDAADAPARTELALALRHGIGLRPDVRRADAILRQLAATPDGIEARLLLAVNRTAEPVPAGGRTGSAADRAARLAGLRTELATAPPAWQPLIHATIADLSTTTHGGYTADERGAADAMRAAGAAGSVAFALRAAEMDEAVADYADRSARDVAAADPAWHHAADGYARLGNGYELARLAVDGWPARLGAPPGAAAAPASPATDAAFAARLWRLAASLEHERATDGEKPLAMMAALLAYERSPAGLAAGAPAYLASWEALPWSLGRWLLARRHARGDCAAAAVLAERTASRRRNPFANQQARPTAVDFAWARAWAERAEACATDPVAKRDAAIARANYGAMDAFRADHDARLARARADVAALVDALR